MLNNFIEKVAIGVLGCFILAINGTVSASADDCFAEEFNTTSTQIEAISSKVDEMSSTVDRLVIQVGNQGSDNVELPIPQLSESPNDPLEKINALDNASLIKLLKMVYMLLLNINNRLFGNPEVGTNL